MAYKEASENKALAALDARMARVEALLVQLVASPAQAEAATAASPASEAVAKAKVICSAHPDHKPFVLTPAGAATGSGFHFGWCKTGTAIAA